MKTVFLFRRFSALVLAFCTCVFLFAAAEEIDPSLLIVDDSIADQCRVEDMIDMMTLHEKVCLTLGFIHAFKRQKVIISHHVAV